MSNIDENNNGNKNSKKTSEPDEKLKTMKSRLEKLIMSMKKPDEDELEDTPGFEIKDIFANIKESDDQTKAENVVTDTELKENKKAPVIHDTVKDTDADESLSSHEEKNVTHDEPEKAAQPEAVTVIEPEQTPQASVVTDESKKEVDEPVQKKPKIHKLPDKKVEHEKNLQEGTKLPIKYSADNSGSFTVLAGKFTRILRTEFQETQLYIRSNSTPDLKEVKETKEIKEKQPPRSNVIPMPNVKPKNETVPPKTVPEKAEKAPDVPTIIKKVEPVTEKSDTPEAPKKQASNNNKKSKFSFKDFFSAIPDEIANDSKQKPKPKKPLDDYTDEKDAEDIRTEIEKNLHTVVIKSSILFITAVVSVIAASVAQFSNLFSEAMRTGWLFFAVISFALFCVAVITEHKTIVNGLMPLRHFKANSDTAAAVTALTVGIQSITAMFTPHAFIDGTYHIYVPIAVIALLCNSIGKLLIITRTLDNFKFLAKPSPKYAGKIYTDTKNAEKMTSDFPSKNTIIAYMKRSKFMSNFLRLSYASDPSEVLASKIAPVTTAIALILGISYGLMTMNFAGGISSMALTACVGTPMMCLIVLNIPMKILCRSTLNIDAMISGYDAVQQFCDTNSIMVDASQLYPEGTVTLNGMKIFRQSKINDAMQAGAAVMYAVNGTMSYIFENMIHCSKEKLPKVDSIVYEDDKGLLAWANKQRILIGNRTLLETHNIKVPKKELEEKYLKTGGEITYISINGELVVMFVLSYKADKKIAAELRELEASGVSLIVRTIDPHITKEKIAKKFGLFERCVTVLPTGLGNICNEVTSSVDEQSRAYLVTKGRLSSFARAVSGCIKMKSSIMISKLLQLASIIFGTVVFTLISFVSGFQKLGSIEILIYIVFWALVMITASLIKNK